MIELNEKREMQQRYLLLQRGPSPGEGHGRLSPAQHSCPRALQCLVARKTQERCCKESCEGFFPAVKSYFCATEALVPKRR